jgi:protein phosphatase
MREHPFAIDGTASTPAMFAICDGMGGEESGEVASLIAVQTLLRGGDRIRTANPKLFDERVRSFVDEAGEAIRSASGRFGKRAGTTLALSIVTDSGIHCYNLGDSRIYCLRGRVFEQITNDHTVLAEKIRNGILTPEQAKYEKGRHKLTRCIGIGEPVAAESYPRIHGGGRILICSDGLTDMVSVAEIEDILRVSARTADAANALLDSALAYGGRDNITLAVADIAKTKMDFIRGLADKIRR